MAVYNKSGTALLNVYGKNGNGLPKAYDESGNEIFEQMYAPTMDLLAVIPFSDLAPVAISPQGLAVYGDYIFQFFTGDSKMRVFSAETFEVVGEYECTDAIHGNTMQFGVEEQDTGFPLLYVSTWGADGSTDSKEIAILKVSLTGYTKVGSITLPNSAGYHPSLVFDWENGLAYSVGFASSLSTATVQPNVITKYDASDLQDLTVLEQVQVPYMGVLNGWSYYNGKLIYCGNTWNGTLATFSFIDVGTFSVSPIVLQKTADEEMEGFDVSGNKLIIANWVNKSGTKFYRIYSMRRFPG